MHQARAGAGANKTGIFTNPTGKNNGIELPQDGAIRADVFFKAVAVHFNGQLCGGIPLTGELSDLAHIIDAADAL